MGFETIQKRIELLEKYAQENRTAKEMLQGELENNPEYVQCVEEMKEMVSKRKRLKDEIQNAGANKKLVEDIKNNNEEMKTLREILSTELFEFYKENGSDMFTDANGDVRKFKIGAKLLPKKGTYDDRDGEGKYVSQPE